MKTFLRILVALFSVCFVTNLNPVVAETVTLFPTKDAWFGTVYNKATVGNTSNIRIGGWSDYYIGLWQFDFSNIPKGSKINSAYLTLPPEPTLNTGINLVTSCQFWLLSTSWTENGHSTGISGWNQGTFSLSPTAGVRLNIPSFITYWTDIPSANKGIAVIPGQINNNYFYFRSRETTNPDKPRIQVDFVRPSTSLFTIKWPLATPKPSTVNWPFGGDWGTVLARDGKLKRHTGTDYPAPAGTVVNAAETGYVKFVNNPQSAVWKSVIVIEHTNPKGGKFCTIYWHVNSPSVTVGQLVQKGQQISSIAILPDNNGNNIPDTHFHFGLWNGAYQAIITEVGALPRTAGADVGKTTPVYPAFPSLFLDVNAPANVLFN